MLSKRSFSPHKSSPSEEEIESPFGKQAKTNKFDHPGKNYFQFINNQMKEEKESDEESQIQYKEEDFSEAFTKSRNSLMNFMQMTQKTKDRNYLTQKELKTKFKVNFGAFPSTDEILKIFNKILKRVTLAKTQKRNWYQEDIILLLWVIKKYCCYKNTHPDSLLDEDWKNISEMIPVKTADQCKFKFLTLKKVDLYKYPWTKDEDKYLKQIMNEKISSKVKWGDIAKELNSMVNSSIFRSGKLCRERWNNYLNPDLKKCEWNNDEDVSLMKLVLNMGKKWSEISKQLPGRNENAVKNRFFSLLRKERKRQNFAKPEKEANSECDFITNSEEITLINFILKEKPTKKSESESTTQEIKLLNLTNCLDNIKLNTTSRNTASPVPEIKEPKPQKFLLKTEVPEERKTTSPPLLNPNLKNNNPNQNQNPMTNSFTSINNNLSPNNFNVQQNIHSNPFISNDKNNTFFSNIIFQNIPKFLQMNSFGYFNPYSFANQTPPMPPPYDNFKFNPHNRFPPANAETAMPQDYEKIENILINHPLYPSQSKIDFYNQTPQTLKNNLNLKQRDPPSFSAHPLVEKANEKMENSIDSLTNLDCLNPQFNAPLQNNVQFHVPPKNNPLNETIPEEVAYKFKIKNGLELNPADYSNCLYSVVNLNKRELYLFTPLSNASESNRSFLSAFFNMVPSSIGSQNNNEDYNSFGSAARSFTKNEIGFNNSFRKIKKTKTYNSLVTSQSSNNVSRDNNIIINNTCISNSPPHSPKKDSKFKGNNSYFAQE